MNNRPIGVFDSGVGGLTVVSEILNNIPNEKICYFGDSKRAPYGGLDTQTLNIYANEIATFLMHKDVKALVVACNTMSATCLEQLKQNFDVPIIGMIAPGVLQTLEVANGNVCLFATKATVESGAYENAINAKDASINVYSQICNDFVAIVEAGKFDAPIAYTAVSQAFEPYKDLNIDTIILGCTHYPFLEKAIRKAVGENVQIVNPAVNVSQVLKELLLEKHLLRTKKTPPKHEIWVSGDVSKANTIADYLFDGKLRVCGV